MSNSLQEIVDDIAHTLDRSVEVTTPSIALIAASAQRGTIDSYRAASILNRTPPTEPIPWILSFGISGAHSPVRLPANPAYGMLARIVYPLRHRGTLVGFLWVIDEPVCASAPRIPTLPFLSEAIAHLGTRAQLARRLLDGEDVSAELGYSPGDALVVHRLYVDGDAREFERGPQLAVAGAGWADVITRAGDTLMVPPGVRVTARGTAGGRAVTEAARRARCMAGIARRAGWEALEWDHAGAWRLLLGWDLDPATVAALSPAAARLTTTNVWPTVLSYLDHGRNVNATADALFVHRATVHYRLARAREVMGTAALDSGWEAACLHVALRLHGVLSGSAGIQEKSQPSSV